ncbi:hypothetical protein N7G274_006973 [Stereocaulon virgatum]|uniref:Uncharacterized protein n=1 Tax=Stereocaulon virgatum TaxID=373712 RepID=A0ABR4A2G7_9LECA
MGRQAYMTRLALGRSPYEALSRRQYPEDDEELPDANPADPGSAADTASPCGSMLGPLAYQQQYDSSGYPENVESRALSRQSRRAQNDVLVTVGVCVGVNADGQPIQSQLEDLRNHVLDKSQIDAVVRENDIGLLVSSADNTLVLASLYAVGFRRRLQTFRFYSGVPLTHIVRTEWDQFGLLRLFFAGRPASLTYTAMLTAQSFAMEELHERFLGSRLALYRSPNQRRILSRLLNMVGNMLHWTFIFVLFPLEIFGTLQELHLVPAWPMYPHPRAFLPFSPSSPFQRPDIAEFLTFDSRSRLLVSLFVSPLVMKTVAWQIRPKLMQRVYAYIRAALPKPQYPDKYSVQGAADGDLDENHIPGLKSLFNNHGDPQESGSLLEELARDLQSVGRSWQRFYDRWMLHKPSESSRTPGPSSVPAGNPRQADSNPPNVDPVPSISARPAHSPASSPSTEFDAQIAPPSTSYDQFSASASRPSTPRPPIEITTSTASSGTQHMNIQIPTRNPTGEPLYDTNFSDSPPATDYGTSRVVILQPYHRLTALTAYSADALASHLSTHITDVLMMPVEALFVRSIALAFLSSPAAGAGVQAAASKLRGEIYPLGQWFGVGLRGGWRGVGDYVGKMVLLTGLEVGVSMVVWQACTAFSWWCGVRRFRWGRL